MWHSLCQNCLSCSLQQNVKTLLEHVCILKATFCQVFYNEALSSDCFLIVYFLVDFFCQTTKSTKREFKS